MCLFGKGCVERGWDDLEVIWGRGEVEVARDIWMGTEFTEMVEILKFTEIVFRIRFSGK